MPHQTVDRQLAGHEQIDEPRQEPLHVALALNAAAYDAPLLDGLHLDADFHTGTGTADEAGRASRREHFDGPAPPYLRSLLGGWSSLRGFRAGSFTGDTVVTGSTELLVPLGSPLSVGQLGVSIFADTGTAYDTGERLSDQRWEAGYGGSIWLTLTAFRLSFAVAHGNGASTRVHFGGGFAF